MVSSSRPAATIEQCCRSSLTSKAMAILLIIRSILSRRARRRALPLRAPAAREQERCSSPDTGRDSRRHGRGPTAPGRAPTLARTANRGRWAGRRAAGRGDAVVALRFPGVRWGREARQVVSKIENGARKTVSINEVLALARALRKPLRAMLPPDADPHEVFDRGTVNGKRVRDWHSGFADYKSADRARTKLLAQLDANTYTPPSVLTVGAYLEDKWLPALRGQVKRPRTYSFHADNVRCHLLEGIGEIPLQKLDASDLDKLYGDLLEAGLAAVTIAHVHETASKALRQARRWKLVPSNVAADASPPEVPDRDMQVWNADELKVFLAATSGDRSPRSGAWPP